MSSEQHSLLPRKIQVLAPRLANQIAAGEVVERPASVVKELVENALDAGATKLEIDIERGGHKLIRVRDNGCGIVKEQLELALSRHATSKISTLDDLEAIDSLGFRGEALASISSVSRLTLTSRPQEQNEAWQCYAQGRDMDVVIKPAAHPVGTTIEVCDLFFNTPARRKFLRTEKTEFNHIDELLKRIALSRFTISFTLKHNGKIIRQYRPAKDLAGKERRLASIFNRHFIESSVYVESEHNQLCIQGWLCLPEGARKQSDWQYCYVNGRMMRDKLINHAIRQAYADSIASPLVPAFLLYISLPATEVDVNVHPAKHEVRFHQARLVHDYIVHVLSQALAEGRASVQQSHLEAEGSHGAEGSFEVESSQHSADACSEDAGVVHNSHLETAKSGELFSTVVENSSENELQNYRYPQNEAREYQPANEQSSLYKGANYQSSPSQAARARHSYQNRSEQASNVEQIASYRAFLDTVNTQAQRLDRPLEQSLEQHIASEQQQENINVHLVGDDIQSDSLNIVNVQDSRFALVTYKEQLYWLSLPLLWQELKVLEYYLQWQKAEVISAPLLLPLRITLEFEFNTALWQAGLSRLGFDIKASPAKDACLIVSKVPAMLRQTIVGERFSAVLSLLKEWPDERAIELANSSVELTETCSTTATTTLGPSLSALLGLMTEELTAQQYFDLAQAQALLQAAQNQPAIVEQLRELELGSCRFIRAFDTQGIAEMFRSNDA